MKYRLKGHESFIIREGWLTKALFALSKEGPYLFQENYGADKLGVGTNMAKSIRYWMKATGLTVESPKYGVNLSELGKIIFENDPYFEDIFSLYILHCNISCNFEQATSWFVFFNDFDLSSFTRNEMVDIMANLLLEKTLEKKLPERSIKDDVAAILSMYESDYEENADPEDKKISPFSQLKLLSRNGPIYEKHSRAISEIDPLVVLYILANELNTNKSVHIDDIMCKEEMPGKILNLNRVVLNECLDRLESYGYLTINRTAGLDMVYLKVNELNKNEIVLWHYRKQK